MLNAHESHNTATFAMNYFCLIGRSSRSGVLFYCVWPAKCGDDIDNSVGILSPVDNDND